MATPLLIKSPKATQVQAVHATGSVLSGAPLLTLFDYEEQKILSAIERSIEENQAKLDEMRGNRITEKTDALNRIVDLRMTSVESGQTTFKAVSLSQMAGTATVVDVSRSRQALALRTYQMMQSAVEAEIFARNCADSVEVFAMIDSLLRGQKTYVDRFIARLHIQAPRSGEFECFVAPGTPVSVGHVLGRIV